MESPSCENENSPPVADGAPEGVMTSDPHEMLTRTLFSMVKDKFTPSSGGPSRYLPRSVESARAHEDEAGNSG